MKGERDPNPGPQHIKDVLENLFRRTGIDKQLQDSAALLCWDAVAGERIVEHATAVNVERGTLFVEVANSVWMHLLQTQVSELRNRLNQELKARSPASQPIQEIRFRLRHDS
jgi:predicted nucleic acid-binding Zn ribbon protein